MTISVGLVGAGPWAEMVHAPRLAAGPDTRLAGVWARRPEAARRFGAPVFERIEELFDNCEAVAFSVPPAVQAELGVLAAKAGKALLLEKPLAADLDGARRLAGAIAEAGVASQMVLTWRYSAATRAFLARVSAIEPFGGHAANITGAMLGGDFATPWRLERGAILDVGPHMIDLLEASLGRVVGVRAHGNPRGWVGLLLEHETGSVSEASLCLSVPARRRPPTWDCTAASAGSPSTTPSSATTSSPSCSPSSRRPYGAAAGIPSTPRTACTSRRSSPPRRSSSRRRWRLTRGAG